jgi:hypothetical protein
LSSTTIPEVRSPSAVRRFASREVGQNGVRSWATSRFLLLVVFGLSAAYVLWHLDRGWLPYDDGTLAEPAARLLRGELSHRDFDDMYTGGLAYLNVAAFALFGTNLLAIRLAVFVVFLAWIPTVYYIALRLVRPLAAAAVTILAVVWSLPNYPAGMPSWYCLFLATFGVAALFRYLEVGRVRWLMAAGFVGGLSFLVKVIGLYYIAGVLLFLVYQAHATPRRASESAGQRGTGYAAFISGCLLLFIGCLVAVVRRQAFAPEIIQFVVPGALIAALLVRNEWTIPAGDSRTRFVHLAKLLLPFLLGAALPVVIFLIPYVNSGSLGAFTHGVFVLPMKRFGFATWRELPLTTTLTLVPVALLALGARRLRNSLSGFRAAMVVLTFGALLVLAGNHDPLYRGIWYAFRNLLPALAIVGVLVLSRVREADSENALLRARTMVLLCVASLCSLVQFPFSASIYFCYAAPLVALLAVALTRYLRLRDRVIPASALVFCIAFAVWLMNGSTLGAIGTSHQPYPARVPLALERGRVRVSPADAEQLPALIAGLKQRAHGGFTWASPDCPEIYFLAGLRNPTRTLYEFFDDSTGHDERILRALETHGVTAIVLNGAPSFSAPITLRMYRKLEQRYPFRADIGRWQVRWRT